MNIKNLTNAYLLELAHTDIDSKTFAEIDAFLKEKLDSSKAKANQVPTDKAKAILIDKLCSIMGVDKVSIRDKSGYQFGTLDLRANGVGPVTVLIIDEG